jgi:uncharacterized membrane protein YphA (DoxX/SURF4 family)
MALGLIFVWAGVSKLAQGKEWSISTTPFSTGRTSIDALVKWALPWCEVVLGALLITQVALVVTGVAACILLAGFTVRIVQLLRRGETPSCRCFGAVSRAPLSMNHVWRNVVFLILSVLVVVAA